MDYELVIIWDDNRDKKDRTDIHTYPTELKAEKAELGMRMAFGNQIEFSCVRPKFSH